MDDRERMERFQSRTRGENVSPSMRLETLTPLKVAMLYRDGGSLSDEQISRLREVNGPAWFAACDEDERSRLLGPKPAPEPTQHIHASAQDSKFLGMKLDRLAAIFSAPVKPVYDAKGTIIRGERDLSGLPELPELEPEAEPEAKKPRVSLARRLLAAITPILHEDRAAIVELQQRVEALEARDWQGIWDEGKQYRYGMKATHSGKIWFCRSIEPTSGRPGSSADWQMMHK